MKKFLNVLILFVIAFVLVACGGNDASDPDVIKIQFVPSNTASEIMLRTYVLERLLADEIPGKTFDISVGTDYNAVVEAMESGQVHVGFLTAQQYAYVTTERPGTAEVILTSVRAALEVQLLPLDQQVAAMNAAGYTGQKSTTETVTSYASILVTKTSTYNLVGTGKINTIADLAGKTVCTQATTSGAGYVYPAVLLDENNLKFVSGTPNASAGEVKALNLGSGYPGAVTGLMSGDCDAAFLFQDARDNSTLLATYPNLFTDTRVVAVTPSIYNDTISVIPTLKASLKLAIQNAFIKIATTPEGLAAIAVYSHTGYKIAVDSDYDGERVVYLFKKNNLS
jgi:phosphonate transport system substrate-binding protein